MLPVYLVLCSFLYFIGITFFFFSPCSWILPAPLQAINLILSPIRPILGTQGLPHSGYAQLLSRSTRMFRRRGQRFKMQRIIITNLYF